MNFISSQPSGGSRAVKGDVASSEHDNPFSDSGFLPQARPAEELGVQQNAVQFASLHGKPDAPVRAAGYQDRVVFLQKPCHLSDFCVDLNLDALFFNYLYLLRNDLPRKAVGGNTVSHHPPRCGECFLYGDVMALLAQVIRGCQSGRASPHNAHAPACVRQLFPLPSPVKARVLFRRIPLDIADRHGLGQLLPLAFQLAGVVADITQGFGKWNLLADHGRRRVAIPFLYKTDIAGNLGVGRAGRAAGNRRLLFCPPLLHFVADRTRGTHLHARAAEAAVRIH